MLQAKDLRQEAVEELQAMAEEIEREIFEIRNELKMNRKIEKPHLLKEKRKDRARILTIMTEKKRERV